MKGERYHLTGNSIHDYATVALDDEASALVIIDQTKLPGETRLLKLTTQQEIWTAINQLQVRGAPAIGVAAAIGVYLAAKAIQTDDYVVFCQEFAAAAVYLNSARPTAVNLSWALRRMQRVVAAGQGRAVDEVKALLRAEAVAIKQEDAAVCRQIGEYALTLVKPGAGLLTHCNAGQLATVKYGTATAPMYLGQERGYDFRIFADETRPLLQGARLTAYELSAAGMDVTLICDSMAASVMKKGLVDAVFVGCDRVAANGDAANKIGTLPLAIVARHYRIPMYFCAPSSTIDLAAADGSAIVIEERPAAEVTDLWYSKRMAPEDIRVLNPAFDVTDNELITAIITEHGILRPPYGPAIRRLMADRGLPVDIPDI